MTERQSGPGLMERLAGWPVSHWKMLAGAVGILSAGIAAGAAYQVAVPTWNVVWTVVGGAGGGALGCGAVFMLYVVLRQHQRLRATRADLRALVNVRPLTGQLPLSLGGWAADPVLADRAVRLIVERQPLQVLECGSGWSTVLAACCLRELGEGRVVSLEHLEPFAAGTRNLLERYGVSDWAEVVYAPIADVRVEDRTWPWYAVEPRDIVDGPVDLLLVDGPPGNLAPRSRYPAVPLFADLLAETWAVLLDDGHRDDEAWIAERWGQQLGVKPELDRAGEGIFVFTSPAGVPPSSDTHVDGPAV